MELTERFLDYVSFDTQSSETSDTTPSTPKQMVFAEHLRQQLNGLGFDDVCLDSHGYIYATLPANTSRPVPVIGFISHYDTSPDCSGANIKPRIVAGYDGGDILLSEKSGRTLSPAVFPELLQHKGEDLIVTDGTTLLGADDKAGIAEIVQAMVWLKQHPEVEHGTVRIAFNPDEEIGMGAHLFDVERFGCEWAYTMDGGEVGEIEYENFNAASARVKITGVSVHPGYAKGKMKNAARIAAELVGMIPDSETPETTQDYEGFYHLTGMEGNVESATVNYIIRDHDRAKFESRKKFFAQVVARLNAKYGSGTASVEISDSYYNMIEKIEPVIHIIDIVKKAMQEVGITPKVRAIRGGTDGAQLSFRGLPCPNIFAGGINFHGPYEFVPVQSMEKAMKTIVKICELTAQTGA